jgi:hypothetical protein
VRRSRADGTTSAPAAGGRTARLGRPAYGGAQNKARREAATRKQTKELMAKGQYEAASRRTMSNEEWKILAEGR